VAQRAHPEAMAPPKPGATRTAPPMRPPHYPFTGRYRAYTLFDWTGLLYLLLGFLVLRVVWALGDGPAAFDAVLTSFENPLYIAFHALALVGVCFVGVRFFRLFPKAQPPRIGPLKPPPAPVILAALYVAWLAATVVFAAILAGGLFR
jgi:fumarate reductase subunit C